jgi:adenylyl-sulfate kinase
LWFTGLSGAGKSTLATHLTPILKGKGCRVEVLDGDEVRENLSKGLGFSKEDRDTNIFRIGYVANLLARNGVVSITAAISPYREVRELRTLAAKDGVDFIEVHARDDRRLAARRQGPLSQGIGGELANFTGVSMRAAEQPRGGDPQRSGIDRREQ